MTNRTHFYPNSNWITGGLLAVLIAAFGVFAETHAVEPTIKDSTFNEAATTNDPGELIAHRVVTNNEQTKSI